MDVGCRGLMFEGKS